VIPRCRPWRWALFAGALSGHAVAAETRLVLEGEVPAGPDHFFVPFSVPPGTVEIEVVHDDLSETNILDWGLEDQRGFRGWGGGNVEPALVGIDAASRSYVAGPIEPGAWRVVVGKAKLVETPARYLIEVVLRDTPTLAPQPERQPYVPAPPLRAERRWYAGDFHVHSRESGDARPPLDEIAVLAHSRGLDFVMLSDHNTLTQLEFLVDAQRRHPELLFVPGMEFTTYAGHANAIGATRWVDHKIGQPGVTIGGALLAFREQDALVSINHPVLDIGDLCIGCAWKHDYDPAQIDAVEIATTGWDKAGQIFDERAIAFWDELCARGHHIAAIGGSDDHRAGVDLGVFDSPVGDPTTLVEAGGLGVSALIAGIRAGRTVVKLQGPADPMIELLPSVAASGDTVRATSVSLRARVTGGAGQELRFVRDGTPLDAVAIGGEDFEHALVVEAPASGETRIRAEVLVAGKPRTVTSHLWLRAADPAPAAPSASGGCGCRQARTGSTSLGPVLALGLAFLARRRGRARPQNR
jgi:hypothetical protein